MCYRTESEAQRHAPCQIEIIHKVYPPVIHVLYACVYMLRIHLMYNLCSRSKYTCYPLWCITRVALDYNKRFSLLTHVIHRGVDCVLTLFVKRPHSTWISFVYPKAYNREFNLLLCRGWAWWHDTTANVIVLLTFAVK